MSELLAAPEARRRMGEAARAKAKRELTWDAVAAQYHWIYVQTLTSAAAAARNEGRRRDA